MRAKSAVSLAVLALALGACDGDGEEVRTAEVPAADTATTRMPRAGMPSGMELMAGMGPGAMTGDWERHMAVMHNARGDSLRAMMGPHRQMAMRMMETMDSTRGGMGMPRDSAWLATRDSLRQDLQRMRELSPEQMDAFLEAHDARMRRMIEMHRSATDVPPQ